MHTFQLHFGEMTVTPLDYITLIGLRYDSRVDTDEQPLSDVNLYQYACSFIAYLLGSTILANTEQWSSSSTSAPVPEPPLQLITTEGVVPRASMDYTGWVCKALRAMTLEIAQHYQSNAARWNAFQAS
ncbi:conserved hypothetical protein [Ricinus communis]|uniref:Aminotransferase-like plant mobile domain-containing protein n=1 Tax=Ricinus communis TaxID=3988 RepID=B9RSF9_RICCO|nr:conserved hypothetical protein [Ricinus communis]